MSSQPVTFTSGEATKKAGDWGGIILNGKAPISGAGAEGTNTANAEINNAYKYGGSDRADNSGALTYVNILYAGARNTADIEHNGLTLNGVGNGTKIQNVYVLESADDAIEFFVCDRSRAWYMDIAGSEQDFIYAISKKNCKIFKHFITDRSHPSYIRGKETYEDLAFKWWQLMV